MRVGGTTQMRSPPARRLIASSKPQEWCEYDVKPLRKGRRVQTSHLAVGLACELVCLRASRLVVLSVGLVVVGEENIPIGICN